MNRTCQKLIERMKPGDKLVDIAKHLDILKPTVCSIRRVYNTTGGFSGRPSTGRPQTMRGEKTIETVEANITKDLKTSVRKLTRTIRFLRLA